MHGRIKGPAGDFGLEGPALCVGELVGENGGRFLGERQPGWKGQRAWRHGPVVAAAAAAPASSLQDHSSRWWYPAAAGSGSGLDWATAFSLRICRAAFRPGNRKQRLRKQFQMPSPVGQAKSQARFFRPDGLHQLGMRHLSLEHTS